MRILYLAHRIPYPPNKGDKIRAFHEICGLSERGHEVRVLAFADDPADVPLVHELRKHCAAAEVFGLDTRAAKVRSLFALSGRDPLSFAYYAHAAMQQAVGNELRGAAPDACVVYSSPMAQYVPAALRQRTVVDLVDVDSEKWRDYAASHGAPMSWLYALEARRLRARELELVRGFGASVLATEREAAILRRDLDASEAARLVALVNGVDLEVFHPAGRPPIGSLPARERPFLDGPGPRVVFTGAMDYYANADAVCWFARDVWPIIRRSHPSARFIIVGSKPTDAVKALAEVPGVGVTGFVEDVRPYLWAADVCVAPLRIARGVQNKVLEAAACGRPVVATREAVAGLRLAEGREVLVADDAPELAAAVCGLLSDEGAAGSLGRAGRRYAEREHSWTTMLERFADCLESLATPAAA